MAVISNAVYGIFSLVGGIIGYQKSKSQVSLVSGAISGILLLVTSYCIAQNLAWALILATIISLLLVIVFIIRLRKTGKFMPAGLMVALGIINLIVTLTQYLAS